MSDAWERRVERLEGAMRPAPEPDMTGWTRMERFNHEVKRHGLVEMQRRSFDPDRPPTLEEELDAEQARDEVILARRAVKAAEERLARWPEGIAAQQAVREARAALDKAVKAAEEAERLAEEARRRPRPPPEEKKDEEKKEDAPGTASEAAAAPVAVADAASPPATPEPTPTEPKPEPQWWEEKARWRLREAKDDDWPDRPRRPLHECIHEYDPLTYDDED
jgi:hypothetical protein